jgi:predicted ATP-dependent endonuclease of OLD family
MAMKRPKICPKVLLVEGITECLVIPELIESYGIPWLNEEIGQKLPYI